MTLYSVSWFCGNEETPCALFSDTTPEEVIMTFCDDLLNAIDNCDRVYIVNIETGVILYDVCSFGYNPDLEPADLDDYALECLEHANDCDPDWEPAGIDDDCGFDPYMGCYTDDV